MKPPYPPWSSFFWNHYTSHLILWNWYLKVFTGLACQPKPSPTFVRILALSSSLVRGQIRCSNLPVWFSIWILCLSLFTQDGFYTWGSLVEIHSGRSINHSGLISGGPLRKSEMITLLPWVGCENVPQNSIESMHARAAFETRWCSISFNWIHAVTAARSPDSVLIIFKGRPHFSGLACSVALGSFSRISSTR